VKGKLELMLTKFLRNIFCLTLMACSMYSYAKRVDVKWGSIPSASKYEYQLSRSESFKGLERRGKTSNLYFVTDLSSGVYYLRVRGLDSTGRAGAWSQPSRVVVEASDLKLLKPAVGERIEVEGPKSSVVIEWSAVEGASDYLVKVKNPRTPVRSIISATNSVRISGVARGKWSVEIFARSGGQVIQRLKSSSFYVNFNPRPRPSIYMPMSGEKVVAWDNFEIKWLNHSKNPRSEVVIKRMGKDSGVISRELVSGAATAFTPKLPPGDYQIIVRNLYSNMKSQAAIIGVTAVEDPLGYHAEYFGVSGEATIGPTAGLTGFSNPRIQNGESKSNFVASGQTEFRMGADLYEQWGMDVGIGARGDRFLVNEAVGTATLSVSSTRVQPQMFIGPRYRIEPLGPSKPIWLKAWLFWRQVEMPVECIDCSGGVEPRFKISNGRILGTGLGAKMRWGGYRSRWDVVGEFSLKINMLASGANLGSEGTSLLWPGVDLRIVPRVKIAPNIRLGLVLGTELESIKLGTGGGDAKLTSYRFYFMPQLSWDL